MAVNARTFEYHQTRIGDDAKRLYTIKCSTPECTSQRTYEDYKFFPPAKLRLKLQEQFSKWGWVLGKKAADDLCPDCVGVTQFNRLAGRFKVHEGGKPVEDPKTIAQRTAQQVFAKRDEKDSETSKILDRFLDTETPAPAKKTSDDVMPQNVIEIGLTMKQTVELMEDLKGLRQGQEGLFKEISDIRAAFDLLAEQNEQTSRAIGQIIPYITRTNEGMLGRVDQLTEALTRQITASADLMQGLAGTLQAKIDAIPQAVAQMVPQVEPTPAHLSREDIAEEFKKAFEQVLPPQPQPVAEPIKPDALTLKELGLDDETNAMVPQSQVKSHLLKSFGTTEPLLAKSDIYDDSASSVAPPSPDVSIPRLGPSPREVTVSCSKDGKSPNRFTTQIRLTKMVWTRAGFSEDMRVVITKDDHKLRIRRAEGNAGIKIKKITDNRIILQSTSLGDVYDIVGHEVVATTGKGTILIKPAPAMAMM